MWWRKEQCSWWLGIKELVWWRKEQCSWWLVINELVWWRKEQCSWWLGIKELVWWRNSAASGCVLRSLCGGGKASWPVLYPVSSCPSSQRYIILLPAHWEILRGEDIGGIRFIYVCSFQSLLTVQYANCSWWWTLSSLIFISVSRNAVFISIYSIPHLRIK